MISGHRTYDGLQEDHSNWWPTETVCIGTVARDPDRQLEARAACR